MFFHCVNIKNAKQIRGVVQQLSNTDFTKGVSAARQSEIFFQIFRFSYTIIEISATQWDGFSNSHWRC